MKKNMQKKLINILQNLRPRYPERLVKILLILNCVLVIIVPGSIYAGWVRITYIEFLNGMAWQPKAKSQKVSEVFQNGVVMQMPVEGTVPRGMSRYPFPNDPERAAKELVNPLPMNMETLRLGEKFYDTYCQPCHGYKGLADGSAVGPGRMPAPNTLHSDKVRDLSDGAIYHVISAGQNTMPGYAKQIDPMDRWATVHYMRALQRSQNPLPEDLPATATLMSTKSTTTTAIPEDTGSTESQGEGSE